MKLAAPYFLLLLFLCPNLLRAQVSYDPKFKAKETIYLLRNGKFQTVCARMDPELKRMMDEDKLMSSWDMMEMGNGPIKSVGEPEISYKGKMAITVSLLQFERKQIGLKIIFNESGQISGLFMVSPKPQYAQPDYVNPASFNEYRKTLPYKTYAINGLLTLPKKGKGMMALIIIPDYGKVAKDKDLSTGPNKPFKDIAWGMAENGIAVFRYDPRSALDLKEMQVAKRLNIQELFLRDLRSALEALKDFPEIDSNQVYIMAHGNSASLIPYFSSQLPHVAGFIALEAPFGKMPDSSDPLLYEFQKYAAPNYLDALSKRKVMFVQGLRDLEVPPAEFDKWQQAAKNYPQANWLFVAFPKLNHLMIEGTGAPSLAEYEKAGNVSAELILKLSSFLLY